MGLPESLSLCNRNFQMGRQHCKRFGVGNASKCMDWPLHSPTLDAYYLISRLQLSGKRRCLASRQCLIEDQQSCSASNKQQPPHTDAPSLLTRSLHIALHKDHHLTCCDYKNGVRTSKHVTCHLSATSPLRCASSINQPDRGRLIEQSSGLPKDS